MHPVLKKLGLFATFEPDEQRALTALFGTPFVVEPRNDLVRETDPTNTVVFLLEGMAYRHKILEDGRRQILGYLLPGDCCDPGVSVLEGRDYAISAPSASATMVRVSDAALEQALVASRKIRHAFTWSGLVEEAISREWIANVGQRSAVERLAHLFCEIYHRLDAIGLTHDRSCRLPLTQTDLGETIGVSAVHINRTLQDLRSRKLVALGDKLLTILDLEGLEALSGFDPTYLHLGARYREAAVPNEPGAHDDPADPAPSQALPLRRNPLGLHRV